MVVSEYADHSSVTQRGIWDLILVFFPNANNLDHKTTDCLIIFFFFDTNFILRKTILTILINIHTYSTD